MTDTTKQKVENLQKLMVVNRIKILDLLYKEDTCVCKMVEKLGMKHNLISHHLKTLVDMGYLESNRNGQHIMYRLLDAKKNEVDQFLQLIK